ncbi:hypothetical protein WD218_004816 [Klebsiella variicola]
MNFTVKFSFQSICFISFFLAFPAFSQQAEEVPPSSIINDAKQVKESVALIGLTKEIIVTGDMLYDSYFIGAETIQFKSGARLIFSDKALATRNNLIIAAKNIVNEDQQKPGVITWTRGDGPLSAPPNPGRHRAVHMVITVVCREAREQMGHKEIQGLLEKMPQT